MLRMRQITIRCPNCDHAYQHVCDPDHPSLNEETKEVDEDPRFPLCLHCNLDIAIDEIVEGKDGVWICVNDGDHTCRVF